MEPAPSLDWVDIPTFKSTLKGFPFDEARSGLDEVMLQWDLAAGASHDAVFLFHSSCVWTPLLYVIISN